MNTHTAIASLLFLLCNATSHAAVTFDWATVGNPGNGADQGQFGDGEVGAVARTFRISKYEVTNAQYRDFLNAVDPAGTNSRQLYSSSMGSDPRGGIVFDASAAGGSKYSLKSNMDKKPVNYVSYFDSIRFVNWLENGQPNGGSGTESGTYTIANGVNIARDLNATYFIPTEDEWYKAAYYQPEAQGGDIDSYWGYPTASNAVPVIGTANSVGDISNPGANIINYSQGADWNGYDGNLTTVGSAGPLSASFYGTFDQGGNVYEWNETVVAIYSQVIRGGDWFGTGFLDAGSWNFVPRPTEISSLGFRIASIPEPSTGLLGPLGIWGFMQLRRKCK